MTIEIITTAERELMVELNIGTYHSSPWHLFRISEQEGTGLYHAMYTEDGTPHLGQEHDTRRNLEILTNLQVSGEIDRSGNDIMTPHRELLVISGEEESREWEPLT